MEKKKFDLGSLKITVSDLADIVGVRPPTIMYWIERGIVSPPYVSMGTKKYWLAKDIDGLVAQIEARR